MSSTVVRNKKNIKISQHPNTKTKYFFFCFEEIQIRKQKLDELQALF